MLLAYFGLSLLALGAGLNVAALQRHFNMAAYIYGMLMSPAFFLSGVFFSLHTLPYEMRHIVAWNPILHGVESFRAGYLLGYPDYHLDLAYLYFMGLLLTCTGMAHLIVSKRGMQ